jgi:hypothetical protein
MGAFDVDPIHVGELSRLDMSDSILCTVTNLRLEIREALGLFLNESSVSAGDNVIRRKSEELSGAM